MDKPASPLPVTFDVTQSADGLQRATLAALCPKLVLLLCLAYTTQLVIAELLHLAQSTYLFTWSLVTVPTA